MHAGIRLIGARSAGGTMADGSDHEQHAIEQVIARLLDTYAARASAEQIGGIVHRIHEEFDDSRIRDFIPLLVENAARQELIALPTNMPSTASAPSTATPAEMTPARTNRAGM